MLQSDAQAVPFQLVLWFIWELLHVIIREGYSEILKEVPAPGMV